MNSENEIILREDRLRAWFTRKFSKNDPMCKIDGFDIGWGGTARFATSQLSEYLDPQKNMTILDVACGYGTFLVEIGWRFPRATLFGLNLDFNPPHNLIFSLLSQGNVEAGLISADAIQLPLITDYFDCVSCFLGLQDIAITRGKESLSKVVSNLLRIVAPGKYLLLLDNLPADIFKTILKSQKQKFEMLLYDTFEAECRWTREIGEIAVELYAQGYLQQQLDSNYPPPDRQQALSKIRKKFAGELENQLRTQGYYNPWGTMVLFILQKKNTFR
ncbi:MAG: class I SAM-dependent methyltransferase [Candidatus Heimdallarchaeota archaeon]|nr:MAG: class I SAM-dependent methyltransferase [Candidatus Heimdallarchaeota archaeon]